jgi:hypothetical protein
MAGTYDCTIFLSPKVSDQGFVYTYGLAPRNVQYLVSMLSVAVCAFSLLWRCGVCRLASRVEVVVPGTSRTSRSVSLPARYSDLTRFFEASSIVSTQPGFKRCAAKLSMARTSRKQSRLKLIDYATGSRDSKRDKLER